MIVLTVLFAMFSGVLATLLIRQRRRSAKVLLLKDKSPTRSSPKRSHPRPHTRSPQRTPPETSLDRHLRENEAKRKMEPSPNLGSDNFSLVVSSIFDMPPQQLHLLVGRANNLAQCSVLAAVDPVISEQERATVHKEVAEALNTFFIPEVPPRILSLPVAAHTRINGRIDVLKTRSFVDISRTSYTIEMKLPQTRTCYAWTYAHEVSHIIVHGNVLMVRTVERSREVEALAELLALLCVLHLSESSPNAALYCRNNMAAMLQGAFHAAEAASQFSGKVQSDAERASHIYGGGLKIALKAITECPNCTLEEFLTYFLRDHYAAESLEDSPCFG